MTSLIEGGSSWVDVRDLGLAHALALEKGPAGGERIIVSAGKSRFVCTVLIESLLVLLIGPFMWQDWGKRIFLSHAFTFS
jgi:nucleoside-diphosphate-sugar epimerase